MSANKGRLHHPRRRRQVGDRAMIRALTLTALAATGAIGTFLLLLAGREAAVTDYARRLNRDVQDRLDDHRRIS